MKQLKRFLRVILCAISAAAVSADTYAPVGQRNLCGTYQEASFTIESEGVASYFPGGEGGLIQLENPISVRGLGSTLYDGIVVDEGFFEPIGRIQITFSSYNGTNVLVVTTSPWGTAIYERC